MIFKYVVYSILQICCISQQINSNCCISQQIWNAEFVYIVMQVKQTCNTEII